MPEPDYECRIAVQAVCCGELDVNVLAVGQGASRSGRPHIAVRVGRVLVYVEDRRALESFAAAWNQAAELGRHIFAPVHDEDQPYQRPSISAVRWCRRRLKTEQVPTDEN